MEKLLSEYYDALDRLRSNSPRVVPKGTRISNDAVSLEAGRKKGSIKKSRVQFCSLIVAIDAARKHQGQPKDSADKKLVGLKATVSLLRQELEAALAREFSLVIELRKIQARTSGENVSRIKGIHKPAD